MVLNQLLAIRASVLSKSDWGKKIFEGYVLNEYAFTS